MRALGNLSKSSNWLKSSCPGVGMRISDISRLPSASLGQDATLTIIVIDRGVKN